MSELGSIALALLLAPAASSLLHAPRANAAVPRSRCAVASAATATKPSESPWLASAAETGKSPLVGGDDVAALRDAAAEALSGLKTPSRKDEAWLRCDLSSLFASRLVPPRGTVTDETRELLSACTDEASEGMRLVLVDGAVSGELSDLSALPPDVCAASLSGLSGGALQEALAGLRQLPEEGHDVRYELGCYKFAALNQASMADAVCVSVPSGVAVGRPLHVIHLSSGADPPKGPPASSTDKPADVHASHPNLSVYMGEGSSMALLQQYAGSGHYFTNGLTRINLAAGANLEHSYVQEQGEHAVRV